MATHAELGKQIIQAMQGIPIDLCLASWKNGMHYNGLVPTIASLFVKKD